MNGFFCDKFDKQMHLIKLRLLLSKSSGFFLNQRAIYRRRRRTVKRDLKRRGNGKIVRIAGDLGDRLPSGIDARGIEQRTVRGQTRV